MDHTETQKKQMRLAAIKRERATLKISMLRDQAARGKSITEMRAAELAARRKSAQRRAPLAAAPEVAAPVSEASGN